MCKSFKTGGNKMSFITNFLKPVKEPVIEEIQIPEGNTVTSEKPEQNEPKVTSLPRLVISPKIQKNNNNADIKSYFALKGFSVDTSSSKSCIHQIESLSYYVAENYTFANSFLKFIRENIPKKEFVFTYSMDSLSAQEQSATVSLAEYFTEYGIISDFFYNKALNTIHGKISSAPRVINFLNGDYLEYYAHSVTQKVIEEAAANHGCDCEIYSNFKIQKDGDKHELDLVFRVGKNIFWCEVKSGKFLDFDCYRCLGLLMGVNPDRHILLTAEKDDEKCEAVSWFYQFYVANILSFKKKLNDMIETSFRED